jgi:hypothetical protein
LNPLEAGWNINGHARWRTTGACHFAEITASLAKLEPD